MKGKVALRVLKAVLAFMEALGEWECKTVGNMHPEGLHCFSCTFNDIRARLRRAVEFWSEGDRAEKAPS